MKTPNVKMILAVLLTLTAFRSWAGDASSDSKDSGQPVEIMQEQKTDLAADDEVTSVEQDEYAEAAEQNRLERKDLEDQLKSLDQQVKTLKKSTAHTQAQAELEGKQLILRKKQKVALEQNQKIIEQQAKQADKAKTRLDAQVAAVEQKAQVAKEKTKEAQASLRASVKENKDLQRRLDLAKKLIAQEQKRQAALKAKNSKVSQAKKKLKSEVSRAEKRTHPAS